MDELDYLKVKPGSTYTNIDGYLPLAMWLIGPTGRQLRRRALDVWRRSTLSDGSKRAILNGLIKQ